MPEKIRRWKRLEKGISSGRGSAEQEGSNRRGLISSEPVEKEVGCTPRNVTGRKRVLVINYEW